MRKRRNWPWILFGVGVVIIVLGLAAVIATVAWVQQNLAVHETTEGAALQEFQAVRARYAGRAPLLELRNGRPAYTGNRTPDVPPSAAPLERLHVLVWDPDENKLTSFAVPFWLLRLKSGSIEFSTYASGMDDEGVNLRPEDIEKYGPGLVLDTVTPDGERILVWTQ